MVLIAVVIDWICIILFVLGFIGNLLGLVVFSSRRFRCCPTYATLALTSFTINLICIVRYSFLLHSTTRRWLSDYIVSEHWLTCKIYRLSSSFRVLAAWITVFWVIERFTYVSSRLHLLFNRRDKYHTFDKYKYFSMIFISLVMISIVTGPTVIYFAPNLVSFNDTHTHIQCTFNSEYTSLIWQNYFRDSTFGINYHTVRFLFSELIPSILVAVFNIAIIICVFRTTTHVRKRQEYQHNIQSSMSMITGVTSKLPPAVVHVYDPSQQRFGSITRCSFKTSSMPIANVPFGKMSWMNIVLILHSLLFFLSSSLTSLVYFTTSDKVLAHCISVIILANCSLNFYIYCLSGKQFRMELKRIAKRYIRNLHKIVRRRCYKPNNRRHSNTQNAKDHVYQTVPQQQEVPMSNLRPHRTIERIKI
ncbi:unnamed protein product [Rotaria magnacalcarata]|uniref:G-protein coupled receptors family 1 profile domain-containing protein n=1 Tax=Rotaria magnacalcarata TaxID=392030 RepID=A0A816PVQ3_9BILA|nr:unnamed protein product [Rotaria magnacalcarata]CAF2094226.1 unnamed protein product [Rotaria magnacalcarata]CAF3963647.1 unnamed protein product [Rotaria magnacalcarata]CAF4148256.1 unnamed protein product [Rotaria magnacalcarata]